MSFIRVSLTSRVAHGRTAKNPRTYTCFDFSIDSDVVFKRIKIKRYDNIEIRRFVVGWFYETSE